MIETKKLMNIVKIQTVVIVVLIGISTFILSRFDHTHFSGIEKEKDEKLFDKIFNRFYFICSTLSSVGYGDIYPTSKSTRLITILLMMIVIYSTIVAMIYS